MKFTRYITMIVLLALVTGCSVKPQVLAPEQAAISIPAGKFYFFSSGCAHCAIVKQYVADKNLKQRLYYVEQQIDNNPSATRLLETMGKRCGIPTAELAVPFFWDGTNCYIGDQDVISYFETIK